MSIIINENTTVVIQGITGNEGRFHAAQMLRYGTRVVAGVTPGKGGQTVEGVPVYDRVADAAVRHGANASVVFVPARSARDAIVECLEAGIKTVVIVTELIPLKDSIEVMAIARSSNATIIGPNTAGVLSPGIRTHIGIMPTHIFRPGRIAMVSRSGTLTYEIASHITNAGLGQSTCIGIGGDPIRGLDFVDVLKMLADDDDTRAVVLIGEIGGAAEEAAAQYLGEKGYSKPVVAYIAGRTAPPEKRMGHAGAIIMGEAGTAAAKIDAFRSAGVQVADKPGAIPSLLTQSM